MMSRCWLSRQIGQLWLTFRKECHLALGPNQSHIYQGRYESRLFQAHEQSTHCHQEL